MAGPSLSDTDWKVMHVFWTHGGTLTARVVCDELVSDTGWAYTTVKTVMDRLVDKQALEVVTSGRARAYRARLTRARAITAAARALARRAFGGAVGPLVRHLVRAEDLSADERAELRRMLDEADRERASGRRRS